MVISSVKRASEIFKKLLHFECMLKEGFSAQELPHLWSPFSYFLGSISQPSMGHLCYLERHWWQCWRVTVSDLYCTLFVYLHKIKTCFCSFFIWCAIHALQAVPRNGFQKWKQCWEVKILQLPFMTCHSFLFRLTLSIRIKFLLKMTKSPHGSLTYTSGLLAENSSGVFCSVLGRCRSARSRSLAQQAPLL